MTRPRNKRSTVKAYGDAMGPLGFAMKGSVAKSVEALLVGQSRDMRDAFKCDVDGQTVEGYARIVKAPAAIDLSEDERSDISLITTGSVDRDREVVLASGGSFKAFLKNPVVTWAHDYRALPVGRAMFVQRQKSDNPNKDGWLAKTQYHVKPDGFTGDWFADAVWALVKAKSLNGKSIGFIPLEGRQPTPDDVKKRPDYAAVEWIISKWEGLEYAVAPIPANADALVTAVSKCRESGLVIPDEALEHVGLYVPGAPCSLVELLNTQDDDDETTEQADVNELAERARCTQSQARARSVQRIRLELLRGSR